MFSSIAATVGAVVYPDSEMVWMWTDDDAVDLIVERGSALEDIAPWIAEKPRSKEALATERLDERGEIVAAVCCEAA